MAFGVRQYTRLASPLAERRLDNYIDQGLADRRLNCLARNAQIIRVQRRLAGLRATGRRGTL